MALTVPLAEIVERSSNRLLGKHESWGRVLLGDIATVLNGFAFKSSEFSNSGGVPLIRIRDVGKDRSETTYLGEYDPRYVVEPGDLLVGMDGDFNCARWRGPRGLLNQRVCKITLKSDIYLPKFLDYTLPGYLKAINDVTSSVTVKHLSSKSIEEIPLPLPPIEVQQRLVAEIEKQFSRLDEAVANLKRVKANLKRFKASVLKAAVEGKLTEDWRKAHPNVEPASKLLERILAERRVKWRGRGKYKEPAQPETNIIGPLPDPWMLASIDQLSSLVTDGDHNPPKRVPEGVPHLTAKHIKGWRISFEDCSYISLLDYERTRSRFEPQPGDFIVTCVGTVGQTAIVPAGITFSADRNLAGIRLVECGMTPKFLQIVLNSPDWQLRMRQASGSTAQPHLYLGDLRTLQIPLPPLPEQETIIEEVERRLSVIEELEAAVQANLTRANRLRQSILQRAFNGDLLSGDVISSNERTAYESRC
ncbi:MAG: restriction endonuclease subunit S [Nitrospiraceae bacterium]|nr:restriction endonuclease subunit S [Nitrospiraceae bacterium]OQW64265.1 MAG: hypothetical protein BVN29_13280 [Nitrospira sp. ST-bin5]